MAEILNFQGSAHLNGVGSLSKDVIRDLILSDKVKTTIFYRNKSDYGQKITNLVKIIGQDELIKRTGGANKSIYFKEITKDNY